MPLLFFHCHVRSFRHVQDLTPLMTAALRGSAQCLQCLLQYERAVTSVVDSTGATPLHLAAEGGTWPERGVLQGAVG